MTILSEQVESQDPINYSGDSPDNQVYMEVVAMLHKTENIRISRFRDFHNRKSEVLGGHECLLVRSLGSSTGVFKVRLSFGGPIFELVFVSNGRSRV